MSLPDDVRAACARVAANARHVRIVEAAIEPYAATLPAESPPAPDYDGTLEQRAAFSLTLNAINFGSGWFPTLRKVRGKSGFWTVESALREHGPFAADELAAMTQPQVADLIGQDREHELMGLFAEHLRELGTHVRDDHDGSFLALARSGDGSAVRLAEELGGWDGWRDVSVHDGQPVPLFKRAQLAAADLALAGIAPAGDLAELTLFADNLVPHVLRIDGVLEVDPDVVARIDAGELLVHDSPEEVEIRACAVHAVDRLVAAHGATTAMAADNVLWHRGGGPRYKAHPRHRARTTDY
jgi:hypothetical protein